MVTTYDIHPDTHEYRDTLIYSIPPQSLLRRLTQLDTLESIKESLLIQQSCWIYYNCLLSFDPYYLNSLDTLNDLVKRTIWDG